MAKRKPRFIRAVKITTKHDMWSSYAPSCWRAGFFYRLRTGMYYGRTRYSELRAEAQEKAS
jgi:hypothetical protein